MPREYDRSDEDDDDDRPRRRPRNSRDDDEDDPPRRRRDADDDYDAPRPRRRSGPRRGEGLAITSMILGIIAIPLACCCGVFSLPVSVTAIILGFVSRSQGGASGKSTSGIICGFVALLLVIVAIVLSATGVVEPFDAEKFRQQMQKR